MDLQLMFDRLIDLTEPIYQYIDASKASMLLFDTSGIEVLVTENDSKYANRLIKQLKTSKKSKGLDGSYAHYKATYASMPSHATENPAVQQIYINGHFCCIYKFSMVTNGLGIIRDITFYNQEFMDAYPDIILGKRVDSPDEDTSLTDLKALIPVLKDFY